MLSAEIQFISKLNYGGKMRRKILDLRKGRRTSDKIVVVKKQHSIKRMYDYLRKRI